MACRLCVGVRICYLTVLPLPRSVTRIGHQITLKPLSGPIGRPGRVHSEEEMIRAVSVDPNCIGYVSEDRIEALATQSVVVLASVKEAN